MEGGVCYLEILGSLRCLRGCLVQHRDWISNETQRVMHTPRAQLLMVEIRHLIAQLGKTIFQRGAQKVSSSLQISFWNRENWVRGERATTFHLLWSRLLGRFSLTSQSPFLLGLG